MDQSDLFPLSSPNVPVSCSSPTIAGACSLWVRKVWFFCRLDHPSPSSTVPSRALSRAVPFLLIRDLSDQSWVLGSQRKASLEGLTATLGLNKPPCPPQSSSICFLQEALLIAPVPLTSHLPESSIQFYSTFLNRSLTLSSLLSLVSPIRDPLMPGRATPPPVALPWLTEADRAELGEDLLSRCKVRTEDSGLCLSGFKCHTCCLWVVGPWASYLMSLQKPGAG